MKYTVCDMILDEYKKLKSGTDVRGIAVDDMPRVGARLAEDMVYDIAMAFAAFLRQDLQKPRLTLAVGHDSRITAEILSQAAIRAFLDSGADVHFCGLITTPAMFMMTKFDSTRCDGVIMLTASHHPYYMNGIKFFTPKGGINSSQLEQILTLASNSKRLNICKGASDALSLTSPTISAIKENDSLATPNDAAVPKTQCEGNLFVGDYLELYAELLRQQIIEFSGQSKGLNNKSKLPSSDEDTLASYEHPLLGMKIVVDAGNGAAGFFASRVLERLGADVSGSQFLQPDGYFPNHAPNPEDKDAMQSIRNCVTQNAADLGIIFDTDGDRVGIVTADGQEINRNRLIAAAAALLLEDEKNFGAYIVTDSVTSEGLKQFVEQKGGIHLRYKRGYKNVIDKAAELCDEGKNAVLAMETSGHAAFKENYFLDDGAYLAVRLIAKAVQLKASSRKLSELIDGLREPCSTIEARLTLTGENWKTEAQRIIAELTEYSGKFFVPATDNYEGIRARVPEEEGWFLLRLSVHDPVMPLNIESDTPSGAQAIAKKLIEFFGRFNSLDISKLEEKALG